jgi:hypothetical protein
VLLTSFPECARLWTFEDVNGIDGSPRTPDRFTEQTVMDDNNLLTKIILGVKGSCMTTIDIEGEVWKQRCHSLLALSSWLEL